VSVVPEVPEVVVDEDDGVAVTPKAVANVDTSATSFEASAGVIEPAWTSLAMVPSMEPMAEETLSPEPLADADSAWLSSSRMDVLASELRAPVATPAATSLASAAAALLAVGAAVVVVVEGADVVDVAGTVVVDAGGWPLARGEC
jgi:hypothetical protein